MDFQQTCKIILYSILKFSQSKLLVFLVKFHYYKTFSLISNSTQHSSCPNSYFIEKKQRIKYETAKNTNNTKLNTFFQIEMYFCCNETFTGIIIVPTTIFNNIFRTIFSQNLQT